MLDKVPPQNADFERAILGALMLPDENSDVIPVVMQILTKDDFYLQAPKDIYEAIITLFEKGINVDLLTVTQELEKKNRLKRAGGVASLNEMIDSVPSVANVEYYAEEVKALALRRNLIVASAKIYNQAFDDSLEFDQVIADASKAILDIEMGNAKQDSVVDMHTAVNRTIKRVSDIASNPDHLLGLPTGFKVLDQKIYGMQKGDFTIIAGRPGMGKSICVQQIAENVGVKHNKPVCWFSLEMSVESLGMRLMASAADVPLAKIRGGAMSTDDFSRAIGKFNEYMNAPIFVDDTPGITLEEIRVKSRAIKRQHGLEMVIVDYVQLVQAKGKHEDERRKLNYIAEQLKNLARSLDVAVVCVSQLSRSCENRPDKRPMLSDLRETGRLEEEADLVIFVYRDDYYEKNKSLHNNVAEFIVGKQRNGPTGIVRCMFDGKHTRFNNY
jgi:replicative DNA helicase